MPGPDDPLFNAAQRGDVDQLSALLDEYPDKLHARAKPYEWSLLHFAAQKGHVEVVDLLLRRGLDVNTREKGDNTYAMHWAAASGHLDVVRRLVDAGGDVIGHGDDHQLEVIGWATCWHECDDDAHRAIARFLVDHGARHHIFSAIAMNLADEVRRIVAADPSALTTRMSRNESHQLPLHFAVRMDRPEMVTLLMELGADPLAADGFGYPASVYAMAPDIDRSVMEAIRARGRIDLVASLALGEWDTAARLLRADPNVIRAGALHILAKRGDVAAVQWLLEHGADPNARWSHWDSDVTPLHLAVLADHPAVVRELLAARADPRIRDTKHESDARGWAEFFRRSEISRMLEAHVAIS